MSIKMQKRKKCKKKNKKERIIFRIGPKCPAICRKGNNYQVWRISNNQI
jgi:hypothetical protein